MKQAAVIMMAVLIRLIVAGTAAWAAGQAGPAIGVAAEEASDGRFARVELFIDAAAPLAAYQLEFRATAGRVRIVGIEGGEHPAFADPPYYDPAAMRSDRAILAAFSLNEPIDLPRGSIRVATVHVMIEADAAPQYEAKLITAVDADGRAIDAKLRAQQPQTQGQ